ASEALRRLVYGFVARILLPALEDEVLKEMRRSVLLGELVARAGVEGHQHGQRAGPRQRDGVDGQVVRPHGGGRDLAHERTSLEQRGCRRRRNGMLIATGRRAVAPVDSPIRTLRNTCPLNADSR